MIWELHPLTVINILARLAKNFSLIPRPPTTGLGMRLSKLDKVAKHILSLIPTPPSSGLRMRPSTCTLARWSSSIFMSTICIPMSRMIALGLYLMSSRALSKIRVT